MEQLFITLFEILLIIPGAALVWLYFLIRGNRKSYRDCFKSYYQTNAFLGFLVIAAAVLLFRYLIP
jgi:hypothetical protein